MTGAAWFLLPVLTPILVMLAALLLQRFETIVMNQANPTLVQESLTPLYGFDADSVTPTETTATLPSRQPSVERVPVTVMADAAVHASVKTPSTEAVLSR